MLTQGRIEITDGRAWAKCETCEDWFLVRWDDAASLGIVQPLDTLEQHD